MGFFIYPIAKTGKSAVASSPSLQRRVERVKAVSGSPELVRAGSHKRLDDSSEKEDSSELQAVSKVFSGQELAPDMVATLNALHGADAEVAARAVLSAAKVAGPIRGQRLQQIMLDLHALGASAADREWVMSHLNGPPNIDDVVSKVHDSVTALEAYAVSATIVDKETTAGQAYLADLAARLKLNDDLEEVG